MHIYLVPAWYPENSSDITASFFREQAWALARRGHQVTVIKIKPITCKKMFAVNWHTRRLWQDGPVRVFYHDVVIPCPKRLAFLQQAYLNQLYTKIIEQQVGEDKQRQTPPEVIHAHVSLDAGFHCVAAARNNQLPLVVTEHYSGLLMDTINPAEWKKVAYTIEHCDQFVFVGSNFRNKVCRQLAPRQETMVIPNMVDVEKFRCREAIADKFRVLCACHLKKNKSVNLIIEAFAHAFRQEKRVELVIAGEGEETENLLQLANRLGLAGKISFSGRCSREQMAELFSRVQLFALTSEVEAFGIVYIEALASGIPIIGTKGQGAEDIVTDANGFLVEYGDIDELVLAMRTIYEKYGRYNSLEIRKDCITRFSEDSVCRQIENVYNRVVGERR